MYKQNKASEFQKEFLISYMELDPFLARDAKKHENRENVKKRKKKWEDLTHQLNDIVGAKKNPKQWRKYWVDQRLHIKERQLMLTAPSLYKGTSKLRKPVRPLTDFEKRVLSALALDTTNSESRDSSEIFEVYSSSSDDESEEIKTNDVNKQCLQTPNEDMPLVIKNVISNANMDDDKFENLEWIKGNHSFDTPTVDVKVELSESNAPIQTSSRKHLLSNKYEVQRVKDLKDATIDHHIFSLDSYEETQSNAIEADSQDSIDSSPSEHLPLIKMVLPKNKRQTSKQEKTINGELNGAICALNPVKETRNGVRKRRIPESLPNEHELPTKNQRQQSPEEPLDSFYQKQLLNIEREKLQVKRKLMEIEEKRLVLEKTKLEVEEEWRQKFYNLEKQKLEMKNKEIDLENRKLDIESNSYS